LEEILEKSNVNKSTILNKVGESVFVIDKSGKITHINWIAKKQLVRENPVGKIIYSNLRSSKSDRDTNDPATRPIEKTLCTGESIRVDQAIWAQNGSSIPVSYVSRPLRDIDDNILGAIVSLRRANERYAHVPGRLMNHSKFHIELRKYLGQCQENNESAAVLLLDVDRFKDINNSFGVDFSDRLLEDLSNLIVQFLDKDATIARFGGDEFLVLLPDTGARKATYSARELLRSIRQHGFAISGSKLQISVSAGMSLFPDQGHSAEELLAKAGISLTSAKKAGRNQLQVFNPEAQDQQEIKSRLNWVRKIDKAIKRNNFVLYAQPILELSSERISHYEVLIRMLNKDMNLIPPGAFLPVAEKFGLSRDIDKWVVKRTLKTLAERCDDSPKRQFAINLSGQSLTSHELLQWLKNDPSLDDYNFENILFEVTETSAVSNINSANNFISTLKSKGSQFALDDFGMGFSSFNYLRQLSVDYLKIDGSFIQNLPQDSMNQDLVQSIVDVAHKLDKETIAEFVEDEKTLEMVKNYGSDHAQGFHIGKPRPMTEVF